MISSFALILAAGSALAAAPKTAEGTGGAMLTNAEGMTLYTFDKDTKGVSNCDADCLANWPAAVADAGDKAEGDFAIIDRADGTKQWTYKGMPLYTFVKDTAAGEVKGDGLKDVWHVARP
ncbi:hypothetical protein [Paracoccus suum]|nr:hypothetical protein [Paracoccus suum]